MRTAPVLALAIALAFTVRVAPARHVVLTPAGVNFQDDDSWFHMRSVHNLVAHFPVQSGFDPYALFPGGQVLYTEPWDLAIASLAWILGLGHPGPALVDLTGAWLPAVLGALIPIPVFFLGRRFFGELAAQLSAIAVAVMPGTLLWETHLGVPDHHVAECLLSLLVLASLCGATERNRAQRTWLVVFAGLSLGVYLMIRPAGIFVPGIFAVAALLEPVLAPYLAAALSLASIVFLTSSGNKWAQFTWLSLACSAAACLLAWALGELWSRKRWPRASLFPAVGVAALCAMGIVAAVRPAAFFAMAANIGRFFPGGHDVFVNTIAELAPLWKVRPGGFAALFESLGGVWIVGLPFLLCVIPKAWRARRPALTLFAVWAIVMTVGGFIQVRMTLYSSPVLAVAAGAGAAWAIERMQGAARRFRIPAVAAFVLLTLATSLPADLRQAGSPGGLDSDWRAALAWLARNTPDPMGDPAAWSRFWPRLNRGKFSYPDSAYGVLTWWQYGDQVNAWAHRIPNTNGTLVHADSVAAFLAGTDPDRSRDQLGHLGSRYVILNSTAVTSDWPAIVLWAEADGARYQKRIFALAAGGRGVPVTVYLPDFYRSMASRLYLFDGRASTKRFQISVFTTRSVRADSGEEYEVLLAESKFPSERKAWDFMAANTGELMTLGSTDPTVSCVELEDLPWIKRVFTSDETPLRADLVPRAVKIFEVTR